MKIDTLETLFKEELKDLYDAEKRLVRALPKMAKSASSEELRTAFEDHFAQTKTHVERLEQVFESLGVSAKAKPCAGMKGLLEEGEEAMGEDATEELKDAALIGAAQRVEHYEMAAYGVVRAIAERLGKDDAVQLLQETLDEEKAADEKLTLIAEQVYEGLEETESRGQAQPEKKPRSRHA